MVWTVWEQDHFSFAVDWWWWMIQYGIYYKVPFAQISLNSCRLLSINCSRGTLLPVGSCLEVCQEHLRGSPPRRLLKMISRVIVVSANSLQLWRVGFSLSAFMRTAGDVFEVFPGLLSMGAGLFGWISFHAGRSVSVMWDAIIPFWIH